MQHATLQHKITRPENQNIYLRENFFSIIDACRKNPVIWISAPPGAGKTTLISSYIESRNIPCLWYQVDSTDTDPAIFFQNMGLCVEKSNSNKETPLPYLTPEYLLGLSAFSQKFFLELYSRVNKESFIVFDNYQEAPYESMLHDVLHSGIGTIPEGINIVFISRTTPPPVLSRLRIEQTMEMITWDDLRLTSEETNGIALNRGLENISDSSIRRLLAKTDGWVAGLVLLIESGKIDILSDELFEVNDYEEIFEYFSKQFFQKLNDEEQEFLLKSSLLPTMTTNMAEELTGYKRATHIITDLSRKSYFIQKHISNKVRYQFHPLFRDFLLTLLEKNTATNDLIEVKQKAAELLNEDGQVFDAIKLFHQTKDWDILSGIICNQASTMLEQGKHRTLLSWLDLLPKQTVLGNPWLLYWQGTCELPFDQIGSSQSFERAYTLFYDNRDPHGTFLSWAGVVNATIHAFDDLKPLDRWIDLLDEILIEFREFPSKEIEVQVSLWMFVALSFRSPGHKNMQRWMERAYIFFDVVPDPDKRVLIGLPLVDYFIWVGDIEKANIIVGKLSKIIEDNRCTPMSLISVKLAESLNNWFRGNLESCLATISEGLELAETNGLNVYNYFFYGHGVVCALTAGDISQAEFFHKDIVSVLDERKRLCASYYHHITACYNLFKRDFVEALEHEKLSLGLAAEMGNPFAEAMSRSGVALISYELGKHQVANDEISLARELAVEVGSKIVEFICNLFEAYFALDSGDRNVAIEKISEAMHLGSTNDYVNFHMWNPVMMSRLCALALEEDIEENYVRKLILKRNILPTSEALGIINWPWQFKIYLIGRFEIIKEESPLQFGRKPPKKLIELLKELVFLGGSNVPIDKLIDTLWPDSDGDSASFVFYKTLSRIRKFLGNSDALLLHDGKLSLNSLYCWVDVHAFNDLASNIDFDSAEGLDNSTIKKLENAIALYGDGFNGDTPRGMALSKRMDSNYRRCILKLGSHWEESGLLEKAGNLYKQSLGTNITSEELYCRLLFCNLQLEHWDDAVITHKNLMEYLTDHEIEPSPRTKTTIQRFLSNR